MLNFAVQKFSKRFKIEIMARVCQITGKKAMVGNNVSHSNLRTKRRFNVNLMKKRFFDEETQQWITLRVSAKGIRTITKKGLAAALKEARQKGYIN
jgi:large subunit ribosomal protein L28